MILLAFGLTLNVQTGLGVSPIISVAYSTAFVAGLEFADVTFALYAVFVIAEILIHTLILKRGKSQAIKDALQFPLSLVFTRFIALFQILIPDLSSFPMWQRLAFLLVAIAATGIGAAASLEMNIVPNPGDGIVRTLSELIRKSVGFSKNLFDAFNVLLSVAIGLLFAGKIVGIGIGTLIAIVGVGRFVALYSCTFGRRIAKAAALE